MAAVGRILLIILVILVIAVGAGFFLLPNTASKTESISVSSPAPTVLARLASTPAGTQLAEGVTLTEVTSTEGDTVVGTVAYADQGVGRVTYTVTPEGEGSNVRMRLEKDLGSNPVARFTAIGGGPVTPVMEAAVATVTGDLTSLPNATFEGLAYVVEQVAAQPFFYVENCSDTSAESITSIIQQATEAIPPIMRTTGLTPTGPLMAVEPRVVGGQYCYQVGYPYRGRTPRALLIGKVGQTPSGTVLRLRYDGEEAGVMPQVYNRVDALLAAARVDDPATSEDDWTTYEIYNDDPTQAGGSRSRDVFYVAQGDITPVTNLVAPASALPAPAPTAPAAAEPAATPEAAPETPAATPAETPEPAPATP